MKKTRQKRQRDPAARGRSKPAETQNGAKAPPGTDRRDTARRIREIFDRLFDGRAEEIVKSLAESGELTPAELARMKEIFGKTAGRQKKSGKKVDRRKK